MLSVWLLILLWHSKFSNRMHTFSLIIVLLPITPIIVLYNFMRNLLFTINGSDGRLQLGYSCVKCRKTNIWHECQRQVTLSWQFRFWGISFSATLCIFTRGTLTHSSSLILCQLFPSSIWLTVELTFKVSCIWFQREFHGFQFRGKALIETP